MQEETKVNRILRLYTKLMNGRLIYKSEEALHYHNVINLRKRTMPDIITPLYRVKIFGIALDMKSS